MFLKEKATGDLIRIEDLNQLASPHQSSVVGRRQAGEEEQDAAPYSKIELTFPSGESLPRCWLDAEYQLSSSGARLI